jgi:hypothetical protein
MCGRVCVCVLKVKFDNEPEWLILSDQPVFASWQGLVSFSFCNHAHFVNDVIVLTVKYAKLTLGIIQYVHCMFSS